MGKSKTSGANVSLHRKHQNTSPLILIFNSCRHKSHKSLWPNGLPWGDNVAHSEREWEAEIGNSRQKLFKVQVFLMYRRTCVLTWSCVQWLFGFHELIHYPHKLLWLNEISVTHIQGNTDPITDICSLPRRINRKQIHLIWNGQKKKDKFIKQRCSRQWISG